MNLEFILERVSFSTSEQKQEIGSMDKPRFEMVTRANREPPSTPLKHEYPVHAHNR
jgi:hypothetical protein